MFPGIDSISSFQQDFENSLPHFGNVKQAKNQDTTTTNSGELYRLSDRHWSANFSANF
jgi:hypothetical protein